MTRALASTIAPALVLLLLAGCGSVPAGAGTRPTTTGTTQEAPAATQVPPSAPATPHDTPQGTTQDTPADASDMAAGAPAGVTSTVTAAFEETVELPSGLIVNSITPRAYEGPECAEDRECTLVAVGVVNASTSPFDPADVAVWSSVDRRNPGEPVIVDLDAEGVSPDGLVQPGGSLIMQVVLPAPADAEWVVEVRLTDGAGDTVVALSDSAGRGDGLGAHLTIPPSHDRSAVRGDDPSTGELAPVTLR